MRILSFFHLSIIAVLFPFIMTGCNQNSSDSSDSSANNLSCTFISAAAYSAEPFDLVALNEVGDVDSASFYVHVDGLDGNESVAPLFDDDAGGFEFRTPVHPSGRREGGSVLLTVTDGEQSCPSIGFTITPLALPDDTELLTKIWDVIDTRAAAAYADAGTDADTLRTAVLDELPPDQVILALVAELQAAIDPAAEFDDLDAPAQELVLAILDKLGLASVSGSGAASVAAARPLSSAASGVTTGSAELRGRDIREPSSRLTDLAANAPVLRATVTDACTTVTVPNDLSPNFQLDTPQQLANLMREAAQDQASFAETHKRNKLIGHTLLPLSAATPDPRIKAGVGLIKVGLYALSALDLYQAYSKLSKPDELSRLEFNLQQRQIEEDWNREQDGDITWTTARVWATSPGLRINGPGETGEDNPEGFDSQLPAPDLSPGEQAVQDRLDQFDPGAGKINCLQLLPVEYGPVLIPDDSGAQWTTAELIAGEAVILQDVFAAGGRHRIEPSRIGDATIRVITSPGAFPGPRVFADKSVSILQKRVQWTMPEIFVDQLGTQQQASFNIANSKHAEREDLVVEPGANVGIDRIDGSGGAFDVLFTTPSEPEQYPTSITVMSTSKELPPPTPERKAVIEIKTRAAVNIDGEEGLCIDDGEPYDFTATYTGPEENPSLTWSVISGPGSISSDAATNGSDLLGTYTSQEGASGTVTIRIESNTDSELNDEYTFRVGECKNVQVFYTFQGGINIPEGTSSCGVQTLDEDYRVSNFDEEGVDARFPPQSAWVANQDFSFSDALSDSGSVARLIDDSCVTRSFPAGSSNTSSVGLGNDGDTVSVEFDQAASAACAEYPPSRNQTEPSGSCSTGSSVSSFWVRYDIDIEREQAVQVPVSLVCTNTTKIPDGVPVVPNVNVTVVRVAEDGQLRPNHMDPGKFFNTLSVVCDSTRNVNVAPVIEFDAPTEADTTDRGVIAVNGSLGVTTSPELPNGTDQPTGTMVGTVELNLLD